MKGMTGTIDTSSFTDAENCNVCECIALPSHPPVVYIGACVLDVDD